MHAVFARPGHHLPRRLAILDRAEADLAEHRDAGLRQIGEILLDHALLDHRRAGMNLHARGTEGRKLALRRDRQRLQADDVGRAAGRMHLAGRDHGGDAAMQAGIDPADLVLARRPVAGDGMDVAVDQAGRQRRAAWHRPASSRLRYRYPSRLPKAVILPSTATIVSASRIGLLRSPESMRPIFSMTSLVGPARRGRRIVAHDRSFRHALGRDGDAAPARDRSSHARVRPRRRRRGEHFHEQRPLARLQRRQHAAADLDALGEQRRGIAHALFGEADQREALVLGRGGALDQAMLRSLRMTMLIVEGSIAVSRPSWFCDTSPWLHDRRQRRHLRRCQVVLAHHLLEAHRRALMRAADDMRRVAAELVAGCRESRLDVRLGSNPASVGLVRHVGFRHRSLLIRCHPALPCLRCGADGRPALRLRRRSAHSRSPGPTSGPQRRTRLSLTTPKWVAMS